MSIEANSSFSVTHTYITERSTSSVVAPGQSYLLVVEGTHSYLFPLPEVGDLIIGRAPEAGLRLHDPAASRQHARLRLTPSEIECTDLGSHNGTCVNGERIVGARTLASSDEITICGVTLVLHSRQPVILRRQIAGVAQLRPRVSEELTRGLRYQYPVCLVCLELDMASEPVRMAQQLLLGLRDIDFVAWGNAPGQLWLLLPDRTREDLGEFLSALLAKLTTPGAKNRAGYAICPADGRDADTLLAAARITALGARPGGIAWSGDATPTRRVGEREIIVADAAMIKIYDLVEQLAGSELAVLIHGETGSGKELIAQTLHERSPRHSQRFVTLNCAAFQDTMLESELFGHERGAFTGAIAAKPGLLELAHGGTLFLDEVAELSLSAQTKLLRALEEKRVLRVGGVQKREAHIRIVAATHQDLAAAVEACRFRKDLYYRLRHARIVLPPLRDRPRELPLLARAFLADFCRRQGRPSLEISDDAMNRILTAAWPGNVRELRAAMEFAATTTSGDAVEPWHLPDWVGSEQVRPAVPMVRAPAPGRPFRPIGEELRELEESRMRQALEATDGNQTRAAELLRMALRTFYLKVKQYGLVRRDGDGSHA